MTLTAIDGDAPLNLNHISKTVNRGLNMRKVVETVCNDSEVKTPINTVSDGLSPQTLPAEKSFTAVHMIMYRTFVGEIALITISRMDG